MTSMNVSGTMSCHTRNGRHVTHQFRGTVPGCSPPAGTVPSRIRRIHDQAQKSHVRAPMLDSSSP
jgi:hypothetical protein